MYFPAPLFLNIVLLLCCFLFRCRVCAALSCNRRDHGCLILKEIDSASLIERLSVGLNVFLGHVAHRCISGRAADRLLHFRLEVRVAHAQVLSIRDCLEDDIALGVLRCQILDILQVTVLGGTVRKLHKGL